VNRLKKYPAFSGALIALAVLVAGESWCVCERVGAARKAQVKLEQKRRKLRAVAAIEPAPTAEIAAQIEADLARTNRAVAATRAELKGRGPAAEVLEKTPAPARRPEAFFDIAAFVEKMRDQARRAGVAIKADERFGFAEYANTGPEPELIPAVFRERLVAEHLLEALFAARPRQLLAVQRERPREKTERTPAGGAAYLSAGAAPDFFEIDPRVTARVPGFVEATAFRVSFIGQTAVLRALLNKLAGFELPMVVRAVEVEPAGVAFEERPAAVAGGVAALAPLVPRSLSRFTVTVEFIDLAAVPAPAT